MATGRKQHIVPQMMIKRFAGDDGKLLELYKPTLALGSRRKFPKGILYQDDFYRDQLSDFDNDVLTPIEQRFARFYPALTDRATPEPLTGKGGAALIDWIAAMLVRTRAHSLLASALASEQGGICAVAWTIAPAVMNNLARTLWLSECQDLLTRPKVRWKFKMYRDDENVVLSDHPVCQTSGIPAGGQVTIVPLSKNRVLFGGTQEATDQCNIPVDDLNAFLAGCAERSVFAADSKSLEAVARNLRGAGGLYSPEWCDAARRPFFGFADRLKAGQLSLEGDTSRSWDQIKDSYGESILPLDRKSDPHSYVER